MHLGLDKIRVHRCRNPCKFVVGRDPLSKSTVRVKKSTSLIVLARAECFPPLSPGILVCAITITCQQCVIRCHGNVPHQIFIKADHLLWSLMLHGRSCCSCYMLHHFNVFICTNNTTLSSSSSLLYRNVLILMPCLRLAYI